MIPQNMIELIHQEIDGANTPDESRQLQERATIYPFNRIGVIGRGFRFYSDRVSCYIRDDAFAKKFGVQHAAGPLIIHS